MDEAVQEAIVGLRSEVGQVRHDISELRDDLKVHVADDNEKISELTGQVNVWIGSLTMLKWICGAILAVLVAYVGKHW